jgi:hypothetical protein
MINLILKGHIIARFGTVTSEKDVTSGVVVSININKTLENSLDENSKKM